MTEESGQGGTFVPMTRSDVEPHIMDIVDMFLDEVPNLPIHVHKLLHVISDIDADIGEITNIASSDPGIVSRILRVVNSSYYGLTNSTDNLNFAIVLLGFNEVKKIALQSSLVNVFGSGWEYEGYDTTDLWEHAYLVSVCAESLERSRLPRNSGSLMTLGLLHDIGKFALFKLAVVMKQRGLRPLTRLELPATDNMLAREEKLFGLNHAIVGGMLAEKWGLPPRICTAIEMHHHPSYFSMETVPEHFRVDVATVSLSDWMVNHITMRNSGIPDPRENWLVTADYPEYAADSITPELRSRIETAIKFVHYLK